MKTSCLFSVVLFAASRAAAVDLHVPQDHATIEAAIDAAVPGDTVIVAPGDYVVTRPIVFGGKSIALRSSAGPETTSLRMGQPENPARGSIVAFEGSEPAGAVLEGFTLEGGTGTVAGIGEWPGGPPNLLRAGGAVFCGRHAEPRIRGNVFRGNTAEYGGAVFCDVDSAPVFTGNRFLENTAVSAASQRAAHGGAMACLADSNVFVEGGLFSENTAYDGGAVYLGYEGALEMRGVELASNRAQDDGGAILCHGRSLRLLGSQLHENEATDRGGALMCRSLAITPVLLEVDDCAFERNEAGEGGGLTVEVSRFLPGQVENPVKVTRCRFTSNRANFWGGGLSNGYESGLVRIEQCRFEDNVARWGGGAHADYDALTDLKTCLFAGNHAQTGGGFAGLDDGISTFLNCIFQANTATVDGGGLSFVYGGIHALDSCTIAGNSASTAGGGLAGNAPTSLNNCIVWGNAGGQASGFLTASFSCIEGPAAFPGAGNINLDPRFAGWREPAEVYVDATSPGPGDGSPGSPFRELKEALRGYSLALLPASPCIGTGQNGADMGADTGRAGVEGLRSRLVHLAAGVYATAGVSLANAASLDGAGPLETVLEGTVLGLRSGSILSDVTVRGGSPTCISVGGGENPRIRNCWIEGAIPDSLDVLYDSSMFPSGCGLFCGPGAAPLVEHCTITGNTAGPSNDPRDCSGSPGAAGSGIYSVAALPVLESCIVWGNAGGSIWGVATATRSCVDGKTVWPGEGNINRDPLFAGWGAPREVFVDPASAQVGDGSSGKPYQDLAAAFTGFSAGLTPGSPCLGAGEDGSNMGADLGVSGEPVQPARLVHLAPGQYTLAGLSLAHDVSLEGAGADSTTLHGPVFGLRTGARLAGAAVYSNPTRYGVLVSPGESPEIRSTTVRWCGTGIRCECSSPVIVGCSLIGNNIPIFCSSGATALLADSTIMGNQSGVYCIASSPKVTNCLIVGNSSAVVTSRGATPSFLNCTLSGNLYAPVCDTGGPPPVFKNCIFWKNLNGGICGLLSSSLSDRDPLLVRLGIFDFGRYAVVPIDGEEWGVPDFVLSAGDYHLQAGSPAIDRGDPDGAPEADIEGSTRPCGASVDIGAYEARDCSPRMFQRGDPNGDGKGDIADAIYVLAFLFTGGPEPSCLKAADTTDSGKVDITDPIRLLGYLFLGAAAPPEPFVACGLDATADELGCVSFAPCGE